MQSKKGQTTIFIIIGIIILFSVVIMLFLQLREAKEDETERLTEEVPLELQPVKSYVQECLKETGKQAIRMAGRHGGYIGLSPEASTKYTHTTFSIDHSGRNPTEHDALRMSEGWHIPYWWHMSSSNDCRGKCSFDLQQPPLRRDDGENSIEEQIDRYVQVNLPKCMAAGLRSFREKGINIRNTSGVKAETTIARNDVSIKVEYPLEASWEGGTSTISLFSADYAIDLDRIYRLADEIRRTESDGNALETHALNLISIYSGLDRDLPPVTGTDFSFTAERWLMSDVEKKLKEILSIYVNALQATRTRGFELPYFEGEDIKTGLYSGMVIPLQDQEEFVGHIDVNFNYFGWPIYLYLTDSAMVGPRDGITVPFVSLIFPVKKYDTPYDLSFPVMVNLHDPSAFMGEGYDFFFALESNIRNNQPFTAKSVQLKSVARGEPSQQLCLEKYRDSAPVSLKARDSLGQPVKDAVVMFSSGTTSCVIGETDEEGNFEGKFPTGALGSVVLKHMDYATGHKPYFMASEEPKDIGIIRMPRYVVKNVTIKIMDIDKELTYENYIPQYEWVLTPGRRRPDSKEHAGVVMQRKKESQFDDEVMGGGDINRTHKGRMRLIPGNYSLQVILLRDNTTVIIPEDEICKCTTVCPPDDEECETIDPINLSYNSPLFEGEYKLNVVIGNELYVNVNDTDLELTALNFNIRGVPQGDRKHSDLQGLTQINSKIAPANAELLQPRFVSSG